MTGRPRITGAPGAFVVLIVLALGCRGPRPERPIGACTHVQAVRELRGTNLCEDVWTCARPPGGALDLVGLRRLAPCEPQLGPVVLYLPGMHMNASLPLREPEHDLRLYLAMQGIRTWGVDYRTHAVSPDATATDLQVLAKWTPKVFTDDVVWATGFVRGSDPGPLFVAGFSQGAALAYRVASAEPDGLAGLIILDGARAAGTTPAPGSAAIDVAGGRVPFPERQALLNAVIADPDQPTPSGGFPSAGKALAETLYTAPSFGGHGGLANTRDGVSDIRDLAKLLQRYDRWWPRAMVGAPPVPAPSRPLRVLAFASTKLGEEWVVRVRESAGAVGGPEAEVRTLAGYGHLDVLVGRNASRDVFAPTLAWIKRGGALSVP